MSTHNICFYGEITKIIPKLSSITLLICSTEFIGKLSFINCQIPILSVLQRTLFSLLSNIGLAV